MANEEKRILAALLNAEARQAYAEIVLSNSNSNSNADGTDHATDPSARRARALRLLEGAGLLRTADGVFVPDDTTLRALLAADAPTRRIGVDRFLRDGRIDRYPASAGDRGELLTWVAERAIHPGENLSEEEMNARLAEFHDDHALLRRFLVDAGLLEREPDGSLYRRSESPDPA